jgi:hypothetical protein
VVRNPWTVPLNEIFTPEIACPAGSATTPLMVNAPDMAPPFWAAPPQLVPDPKKFAVALAVRLFRFCAVGSNVHPLRVGPTEYDPTARPLKAYVPADPVVTAACELPFRCTRTPGRGLLRASTTVPVTEIVPSSWFTVPVPSVRPEHPKVEILPAMSSAVATASRAIADLGRSFIFAFLRFRVLLTRK